MMRTATIPIKRGIVVKGQIQMKKLLLLFVVSVSMVGLGDTVLNACGSKFLVSSKSARYQRVLAGIKPTNILWYYEQDEDTPEDERWDPDFQEFFEQAGHTLEVTFNEDTFLSAAKNGDYDVILVSIEQARLLQNEIASLAPDAAVLPILEFPTRSQYSAAREEWGIVLKLPTTTPKFLAAIDKARQSAGS